MYVCLSVCPSVPVCLCLCVCEINDTHARTRQRDTTRASTGKGMWLGAMIAGDLILTNRSYLLLNVPFMEMIKSATPLW